MGVRSIAYFPTQSARNSSDVLTAISESINRRGIKLRANDFEADAVIIWSVLWSGRMAPNKEVYQHYRALGRPVIIVDVGALRRGQTWKIALDHITNQGYYGHHRDLDPDRPSKLGITLGRSVNADPSILLAAQHTSSLQVRDVDLTGWLDKQIDKIKKVSDRPLILRPHPRCRMDIQRFQRCGIVIQQPLPVTGTYDDFDFSLNYHAIVNYNSGPGIQAAIAGARPIVDQSSLAAPVSISIGDIEHSYDLDREQWLIEICHTEYILEEISNGIWIQRLGLEQ